jgi:hypothetical protein
MPISKNLVPGQYQIGETVFGKHTRVKVKDFDEQAYNVDAQDSKLGRSDEILPGIDSFSAQPITFEMEILDNRMLPGVLPYVGSVALPPGFETSGRDVMLTMAREWRGDDVRKNYGAIKPLYCCSRDGITRVVYGRPRKFHATKLSDKAEAWTVQAEYFRNDTLSYTDEEDGVEIMKGAAPTNIKRTGGDSATWYRIVGYGPLTDPIITIGEDQVQLDITLAEGESFEVSSYPWRRRAMDSKRRNLSGLMIGDSQYLDRLMLPYNKNVPVRWTSTEVNTWVPALGNEEWYVDVNDLGYKNLPDTFTTLLGKPVVRFDLFNPDFAERFLASGTFGSTSACIYNKKQFATAEQYSESRIVEPFYGKSGIVIMSTPTMSSFVALQVQSGIGANWLRILSGTSPTTTTVRASWQNTDFFGWKETDVVGIGFNPTTKAYQGYMNGVAVPGLSWTDSAPVVPTGITNRSQGYIFDMDGGLFTVGTGFREMLSYDRAVVPAPTGRIFVLWQDAWSKIP